MIGLFGNRLLILQEEPFVGPKLHVYRENNFFISPMASQAGGKM
jgi:hypothetical protein